MHNKSVTMANNLKNHSCKLKLKQKYNLKYNSNFALKTNPYTLY